MPRSSGCDLIRKTLGGTMDHLICGTAFLRQKANKFSKQGAFQDVLVLFIPVFQRNAYSVKMALPR